MSTPVDKTLRLDRTQLGQKRPSGRPPTFLIAIVAGVVAAIVVALVMMPLFKSHTNDTAAVAPVAAPAPITVPVLVATTAINPRTPITDSMIKIVQEPQDKVPPQNPISNPVDAVGKVSTVFIAAGAPVTSDELTGLGLSIGLAYGIDKGLRAVTIALDPVSSVAGFLKPRDHVDVIGTFTASNGQSVTRTVLQNVLLLATGSQLLPNQPASTVNNGGTTSDTSSAAPTSTVAAPIEIPNATVQVSTEDAQKLIIAAAKGKLQLSLRAYDDQSIVPIPVTHESTVTGVLPVGTPGPAPAPRPVAPPIPALGQSGPSIPVAPILPSITVIKGTDSKTVTVGQ